MPDSLPLPVDAVVVTGLDKTYAASGKRPPKQALQKVDLAIPRGSLFGLLGPNGAGKSTLINILAQLVLKSSGQVKVWDFDLDRSPRDVASAIGVVPQELNIDPFFTPRELLNLQAGLYGVPRAERRTTEILEALGLADKAEAYARTLSGGMRRRLLVAKALVHNPPVLVLDEPTAGVDVELRQQLWRYVRELNARGVTVLLTTHYLEEADALCDRVAIVDLGRIVALGTPAELKKQIAGDIITVRYDAAEGARAAAKLLDGNPVVLERHEIENGQQIFVDKGDEALPVILRILGQGGAAPKSVHLSRPSLDDVFLKLTGRSMRDTGEGAH